MSISKKVGKKVYYVKGIFLIYLNIVWGFALITY